FLLYSILLMSSQSVASSLIEGSVFVNVTAPIAQIDEDFICATIDWGPPDSSTSLLQVDFDNQIFRNAVKAFSPLKIRLGGTLQDSVIYQQGAKEPCNPFEQNSSRVFGYNIGCLPTIRWDHINDFLNYTGAVATFGLNALYGRTVVNGSAYGAWDSSNAEAFIRYTAQKHYNIVGWELGNELTGNSTAALVEPEQYASDTGVLHNLIQEIYNGSKTKPLVIAPGGVFNVPWFTEFIDKTTKTLQVVTHHIYNLGSGTVADDTLIQNILDPTVLDSEAHIFSDLQHIIKSSGTQAVAWVGEAGGTYGGGVDLVTNAFVMNFWYVDELGMSATYDTRTYCRQTLVGGNYSLLHTNTFVPNPDYYSALLWHRLMGKHVLSTNFSGTDKVRAYAHCSKQSKGITLVLLNLDGNSTVQVKLSTDSQNTGKSGCFNSGRTNRRLLMTPNAVVSGNQREEYHFKAQYGDLQSQTVLLNGKVLNVSSSGEIPSLDPVIKNSADPIVVDPWTVVFVHIPSINAPACN
ncbi:hypothetical protein Ancab_023195, partial [Ancistrocladus abbreviatus]